jgi:hypothetical protein
MKKEDGKEESLQNKERYGFIISDVALGKEIALHARSL